MRVGLDIRMIQNSGIGTTIRGLLGGFSSEQKKQLTLYGPPGAAKNYSCEFRAADYPIYGLRQHWGYGRMLNRERLDVYHMPHFDVPLSYRGPLVVTVHDLIHYLFPQYSTKPFTKIYSGWLLRHVARHADRIIAVSENTKRDLLRFFPEAEEKTVVLYQAVDKMFAPVESKSIEAVLGIYTLEPGYVLYVGNLRESKNTQRLVQAYMRFVQRNSEAPPLVLAGKNSLSDFDLSKFGPKIRAIGPVPAEHLPALYSGASLFAFPSLYEGFGLPPLEAMACGTPVITSNVASLPEVCGDAAIYVDPKSIENISQAIEDLLASLPRREELRRKGLERVKRFSWENFAEGTWQVYEDVVNQRR